MGLAQKITLKESVSVEEATEFLDWICEDLPHSKKECKWVIHSMDGKSMSFEIRIIPDGFHIHRSGNYLHFLGFLIEHLTGKFGVIEIEDV